MAVIAAGQISIMDFNDAPSFAAYIDTTAQKAQVYDPQAGTYTPNWNSTTGPVLVPSLFVSTMGSADQIATAQSISWYDLADKNTKIVTGANYVVTGNTLKIINNVMTGTTFSKTFVAEITWINPDTNSPHVIRADFTFTRSNNGAKGDAGINAISAVLSNDADSVPSDSAGNNQNVSGVAATVTVYEGATDVTALWSMGTPVVSGATGTFSGTPTNRTWTLNTNGMTADIATVTWTLTRSGYASIIKKFTISRVKAGVNAPIPTLYRMIPAVTAMSKSIANVFTPPTATATAKSVTGAGALTDYAGRWSYAISTDGTTYGAAVNGTTNVSSLTVTPLATTKAIKIQLYPAGTTSFVPANMIDEQVVTVVSDGQTGNAGADAVTVSIWHPSGFVFKNDQSTSLSAQADLYKGGVVQTSGATYEWFGQKSGQTDQGAGVGWEKITDTNRAAYGVSTFGATPAITTATSHIAVDATKVINLALFKVKATFGGKTYFDTCTFTDTTDPIIVDVKSSNGENFKNGDISSEILCRLYQNGEEIDPRLASATTGYKYTYTWTKYKKDGTQDMTFGGTGTKVGKWIAITDADIDQKAVFKVDIT